MKIRVIKLLMLALGMICAGSGVYAKTGDVAPHQFAIADGHFTMDGKPFMIKAAEMHYTRIPHQYWEHRIKMAKALGMNAMCVYVFWNAHEPKEGEFDFTGNKNLAEFIRLCKKNDMWVIVRPGPYACAEWEMGGLPWWLLKDRDIQLRSLDPRFMKAAGRFEREVARQLEPYRLENGGNIIMVQVENEFGSYGTDKPYMEAMRDTLRAVGWDKTQLFQCDWSSNFQNNALPDLLWTMNFGTGANVTKEFRKLGELRPDMPRMCSEYWSGWFDGWGRKHQTRPWDAMVNGIGTMLDNGISFSLYMTHGGTSFGHWAGANVPGYQPDCTSYDYDAPIDEQGAPTEKYFKLRERLQKYSDVKLPAVPKAMPVMSVPAFSLTEFAPLMGTVNGLEAIASDSIMPMEQYDMGYGSIVYSCTLPRVAEGSYLRISDVHDYARIYAGGKLIGQLYRGSKGENTIKLPALAEGTKLDIYVEAMGRINYSRQINDPKGITDRVELLEVTPLGHRTTVDLRNWQVRLLPVDYDFASARQFSTMTDNSPKGEGWYKGSFNLKKTADTYLDMSGWGKGLVWVNGQCLGRFWNVGPQQTLFLPGCWLRKGANEVVVMDITGPEITELQCLGTPIIDTLRPEKMPHDGVSVSFARKASSASPGNEAGNDAAPGAK